MTVPEKLIVIWTDVDKIDMPATVGAHTPKSSQFFSGGPKNVGFERVEYTRTISPAAIHEAAIREAAAVAEAFATVAVKREMTEAKLAKAMAALEEIASYDTGMFAGIAYTARQMLAELGEAE